VYIAASGANSCFAFGCSSVEGVLLPDNRKHVPLSRDICLSYVSLQVANPGAACAPLTVTAAMAIVVVEFAVGQQLALWPRDA
jgi:hypothetical protein